MEIKNFESIKNIFDNGTWYHSVQFNKTKSKGTFDYTDTVKDLKLPRLDNLSVLDVGCSDGYFAKYFLENLGANYVLGVDFNKYDGSIAFDVLNTYEKEYETKYKEHDDFEILKKDYEKLELFNSNKFLLLKKIFNLNMDYEFGSIYDLKSLPNFDVTFCGSLLEHLRDPITAIEQLYFKTDKFSIIDISNSFNSGIFKKKSYLKYVGSGGNFFHYSERGVKEIMENVGFKKVTKLSSYKIKIEKYGYKIPHAVMIGYK